MNGLGTHILLELKECNPELLNDLDFIRSAMLQTASQVGATIVGESFHRFSPQGVTGILAIAESHISIHTWPEYRYAAADIFACGASRTSSFEPRAAADLLVKRLEAKDPEIIEVPRGVVPLAVAPR